jgi:hypothetical protein
MLTGVVEVGLFCRIAKAAYFGNGVRYSLHRFTSISLSPLVATWLTIIIKDGSVTVKKVDSASSQVVVETISAPQ